MGKIYFKFNERSHSFDRHLTSVGHKCPIVAREEHPTHWYEPVPEMRTLILGTFPPHQRRYHYDFFYPNRHNRFWRALSHVANHQLESFSGLPAVAERKSILKKLKVGLHDTAKVIERKNNSSLDRNIEIVEFNDILKIIVENPTLKVIHLTGYSGPSSCYFSFVNYLHQHGIQPKLPIQPKSGDTFTFHFQRDLLCTLGNSTSGAARSVTFDDLTQQFQWAVVDVHNDIRSTGP